MAAEEEDALDQRIGVLHLLDRFLVFVAAELGDAPVPQHARMQEVLVDGGQLVGELGVQVLDDLGIAQHRGSPSRARHSGPASHLLWDGAGRIQVSL
jgi:hypothetical protein